MPPEKEKKNKKKDNEAVEEQTEATAAEKEEVEEVSELDKLKAENAELSDRLLRNMAEFDNFRKRSAKEKDAIYPEAVANTVSKLLIVADTLEMAVAAPCTDAEYKKGIEKIHTAFIDGLGKLGVTEMAALGEQFDPEKHNAVMHIEDENVEEGKIVEVFQKGYVMGDRVVRYAMVKVAN